MGATLAAAREPDVTTNTVFGYSPLTRSAACWNS